MAVGRHHRVDAVSTDEHDLEPVEVLVLVLRLVVRSDRGTGVVELVLDCSPTTMRRSWRGTEQYALLPLSTYSAPGDLRQGPGRAGGSLAEARTYGNGSREMRVLLSTYGSRGDVEPLVGLAVRLRALGAEARVCAPPDKEFAELLAGVGVPLVPAGRPVGRW